MWSKRNQPFYTEGTERLQQKDGNNTLSNIIKRWSSYITVRHVHFRTRTTTRDKEEHYKMKKGSVHQEDTEDIRFVCPSLNYNLMKMLLALIIF